MSAYSDKEWREMTCGYKQHDKSYQAQFAQRQDPAWRACFDPPSLETREAWVLAALSRRPRARGKGRTK